MPTPPADDFAVIWQRQCAIREAADNARNAAGCAYAEDRPQSECTVCNDPADAGAPAVSANATPECRSDEAARSARIGLHIGAPSDDQDPPNQRLRSHNR